MTPKGLKPGSTYSPKCLKCGKEFSIVVPVDPLGTIKVGEVEPPKLPDTIRTPAVKPKPKPDPNAPGDRK
jgi:hypothetical protein